MSGADRPDPLAALRTRFLARAADDLAWIEARDGAPADELVVRVHKLAGIAGTFGYDEVSRVAAALEDELREGRAADLRPLIAALQALPPPS